ncbi:hydroxymethylglutaryl-CoA reductase [Candidatus Woesebacteria bacterium]|nr:hydroxymethylglutaryl-CoA reductase [Candidatus Woesebacteria bacterium]
MNIRDAKSVDERRALIEKTLGISLENVGKLIVDNPDSIHCENLIGAVSLPLGVAGPISLISSEKTSEHFIPLATTEGALVSSVSRGAKIITLSGGARVDIENVGPTRGPVFETTGILESRRLKRYIEDHLGELKEIAASTSRHLQLHSIDVRMNGKNVYLRCRFDTDEAMGMNMVTIATDAVVSHIEKESGSTCLAVAGNYDVDKKPSWLNFIEGRGRMCSAEVVIPAEIVLAELHVEVSQFVKTVIAKCWGGSMISGSMGFNAHFANIVAAFFAATGQDIAHVVEGSLGITTAELLENGDLYFSVSMPDVMLGTVGGGTELLSQKEARSITSTNTADELSQVLVAAVLAGELSLLASITEKTLGKTHKKLGR